MDYLKSFTNRAHSYSNAMELYQNVLDEEILTAIYNLDLKKDDVLLNIFAGGIPIDKYIKDDLNVKYWAFDMHKDFIIDSIQQFTFDNIPLESNSINKIICLATLHHLNIDERNILYNEFYRILKPEGMLVIADVICNSSQAKWLNEFVDKYNSNGHKGLFFTSNDSKLIETKGFNVDVSIHNYNWNFHDEKRLLNFCRLLFGLDLCTDDNLLLNSIKKYLNYIDGKIPWKLIYFNCIK
jgi:SAM-dependent methyltransferase